MKKLLTVTAAAVMLPVLAHAASVDLTGWIENGHQGSLSAGNWTVGAGNDNVVQSTNGQPTVFFEPGTNSQGTQLSGTINSSGSDDDYYGFVLGYQADEFDNASADFWLIDWKQNNQSGASRGLALSHVTGDQSSSSANDFWQHTGTVNEVARGANLSDTGWVRNQTYDFDLVFTASLIQIYVDNVLEISYSGSFTDGAFGFYNYSQAPVTYAGITSEVAPAVPLPAGLPLMLAGLGAFGWMRRKQRS